MVLIPEWHLNNLPGAKVKSLQEELVFRSSEPHTHFSWAQGAEAGGQGAGSRRLLTRPDLQLRFLVHLDGHLTPVKSVFSYHHFPDEQTGS